MNFGMVIACETLLSIADEMNRRLPDLINVLQQRANLQHVAAAPQSII